MFADSLSIRASSLGQSGTAELELVGYALKGVSVPAGLDKK
jgi:hypothetical protein